MERHDFAIFLSIELNKAMDSYGDARQAPIAAGTEVYQHALSYSHDDDALSHLAKSFLASIIATGIVVDNIKIIKANPNIEKIYANKAADIFEFSTGLERTSAKYTGHRVKAVTKCL